ncbi:alpha/beta hydrolase [Pseudalkalibacillus sp. SCS-8]|uniref:alpha/beta fold hydrolase n=1 Tax=Pseudalkalibacillus nanhaiensis TaxID=3115291 RepID=UPI0032DBDAD9
MVHVHNRQLSISDKGEGMPVIFLHPPGLGKEVFHYQDHLTEHYRVIRYDMCGHGDSEGIDEPVTIKLLSEELLAVLDALDIDKAVICGYSAGGSVAQEFALTYPERTAGLILSGGFPRVVNPFLKAEFLLGMKILKHSPHLLGKILTTSHGIKQEDRDRLWKTVSRTNTQNWYDFYDASYTYSCYHLLPSIQPPTLVIYGQNAKHIKVHVKDYETLVHNSRIAIVRHAFHEVPIREWHVFNQIVDTFIQNGVNKTTK